MLLCSYLSEEEAAESLEGSQRGYAQVAWRFLDSLGLINFGVAKDILTQGTGKRKSGRTVIVVGAGLAGVSEISLRAIMCLYDAD